MSNFLIILTSFILLIHPKNMMSQSNSLPILYIIGSDSVWFYLESLDSTYVHFHKEYIDSFRITSWKGEADFSRTNMSGKTILTGSFVDALDIFKKYLILPSLFDPRVSETVVKEYYQPLKNYSWVYFKKNKKYIVVNFSNDAVVEKFKVTKNDIKYIE